MPGEAGERTRFALSGLLISVFEGVYAPSDDTWLALEAVDLVRGIAGRGLDACADLGAGTGVLGLYALKTGLCRRVVFVDSSEVALENSIYNAAKNGLIHRSSFAVALDGVGDESLDLVLANPPYLPGEPRDSEDASLVSGPRGCEVAIEFARSACRALAPGGILVLVYSSLSSPREIEAEVAKCFKTISRLERHFFFEDIYALVASRAGP